MTALAQSLLTQNDGYDSKVQRLNVSASAVAKLTMPLQLA